MKLLEKIYNKFFDNAYFSQKVSYAQSGEDLIVDFLLTWVLGVKDPCYLDIGAHHPHALNNTYLFYKRGSRGVNIEPDPLLFNHIKKMRPGDININTGVGFNEEPELADFYVMSSKELNTFSKPEAERISRMGTVSIKEIKTIELININTVLKKYFSARELDFLSVDVEGLDFEILNSVQFDQYHPKVICVETSVYKAGTGKVKRKETIDLLLDKGYHIYADTCINTIFVRKDLF